ncbi:apolipoprotein N-acyltransferase [Halorhodospira halochloris]|uniref:apolipoprotein N-acyltransferase n=1 Tax=Halorhodospira halochloris TaxID=1052 RepID=UPI001EE964D9|nr:apolipoprotein N-acyltransferase [Halorhodospira halochloris]MCG5529519.1 apolipoprotein N-acyltransferase [Halorhodospira halochloris]MCG5547496.1 apolipoprotein N-acyltransferase [Halorhodospira halochloris]
MTALKSHLQGKLGVLLAGVAGACLPLSFAPFDWSLTALVAPAILFYIAASASFKRALQAGYAFGLGMFGLGASWVFVSINEYGGAGPVLSGLVTAGFVALLALFPLAAVWLGRWVVSSPRLQLLAALPAAWVLFEWVRTWLFTGFPWLYLGYAGLGTPLSGWSPVIGVLGVSALIAWLAGLLAYLLLQPRKLSLVAFLGGATAVIAVGLVIDRSWSEVVGEPLEVALLQGNHPQDLKWDPAYRQTIRQSYAQMTAEHLGADLIIWPETALPELYEHVAEVFLQPLAEQVRDAGGTLLLGIPRRDRQAEGEPLHNSVAVLGEEPAFYAKYHLVPYGEYVPFRDVFGRSLDFLGAPMADYERGPVPAAVPLDSELKLGITICYEAAYPRAVARGARGADVLVNVSNDAWFGDSLAPHQHLQKARQRAAETRRWMLRSTNTGITAVIDPYGEIVEQAPQFAQTSVVAQVYKRSGPTPYMVIGDWPVVIAVLVLLAAIALRTRKRH